MTLEKAWKEVYNDTLDPHPQNVDFIFAVMAELVLAGSDVFSVDFCKGMDLGIRIGMKYKEMQQKEIEQEIKV